MCLIGSQKFVYFYKKTIDKHMVDILLLEDDKVLSKEIRSFC